MRLEDIEKENPSILRSLVEETIRRVYEYEFEDYPITWLLGVEADFIGAINHWAEGGLRTKEQRESLKSYIANVVVGLGQGKITKLAPESLERIHELLVTINVINEAIEYICEIKGMELLNTFTKAIYDLKKVTEWKRRLLIGAPLSAKEEEKTKMIMTEEEQNIYDPLEIEAVLKKRILKINARLLTEAGRSEIIDGYLTACEKTGLTRRAIPEAGLAEAAEMLNQLFGIIEVHKNPEENPAEE